MAFITKSTIFGIHSCTPAKVSSKYIYVKTFSHVLVLPAVLAKITVSLNIFIILSTSTPLKNFPGI